ncbi:MAG TPA: hypothetical protein DDW52_27470 [Planctomycetaceae bacterium]|nr:hypothetical protein [Planctomycetaceae bacterium]
MKLTKLLLSLSLAGFGFSQASAQVQHPAATANAARHIGDGVRSIGDTDRFVSQTPDVRPAEFVPDESETRVSAASALDLSLLAPTTRSTSGRRVISSGSSTKRWFSGESLLWFSESQHAPPLVTTSAMTVLPTAGSPGVTTQFGGADGITQGVIPGFRFEGGSFIDSSERIAVVGRVTGIFQDTEEYSATSDGSTSLGLPFYNLQSQANDAFLVGYHDGTELVSEGSVNARSDLDMIDAQASLHFLLARSAKSRSDLIAGYTFNRLANGISINSVSTNRATGDSIPDGTVFTIDDLFETTNTFHGAHLGVVSSITASRLSLQTLAKVSFGSVHQRLNVFGNTDSELGGVVSSSAGGIYARPSNIANTTRNTFAFIPEMGLKLGYSCRENVQLTVGYTFMFWSSVAMAGDQIDSTVDLTGVGGRPAAMFNDSTFWTQGIDFGAVIAL